MDLNLEKIAHGVASDIGRYSEKIAMPDWLLDERVWPTWNAETPVERRFAAVEGCAVASLPVEGEEPSTPNPQPSTLNPQPSTRALREGGAR